MTANPARGEAELLICGQRLLVRPSFSALVAAEVELGPLFALVERAAAGELMLTEMAGLLWHCLASPPAGLSREVFSDALVEAGIASATPVLRVLLGQVLAGR
jgi:hypothetical protein